MKEGRYNSLYNQWRRDVIAWDEREQFLLGEIEKRDIQLFKQPEMTENEIYLVNKIEQLEEELRQKECVNK